MGDPDPTRWPRINAAPGWQPLYQQLQRDVAALDPFARVSARSKMGRLSLHVHGAEPGVLQAIKDLCIDAEAESMCTCQACGQPGTLRGVGEPRWVRPLCDTHNALPDAELHALMWAADTDAEPERTEISALTMYERRPRLIALLNDGWRMVKMEKPVMEGHRGELTTIWFERP